ncbi:uncharacterized protein [Gossypium hirsutum]|uniref:RNase H type-1 domain-containing protein n=1 Tax=Gossypium hirsutum TaxID=3635 RepID=A0ABM2YJW0_GOSHI|nr:uncharacterized protein LOC121203760 [Gossypium hirsutum]
MESNALNERMARWQILFSEFDIIYTSQKAVKGSAIVDFLASRALEDYEPLNFDFPNEEIVYVAVAEEDTIKGHFWKLNFDRASNVVEYEACIMGLKAAIEHKIKVMEVYGDSGLVIYQLREEEERDDHHWYPDILRYVRNHEYPNKAMENDKRTLRRLACDYVLDGEILTIAEVCSQFKIRHHNSSPYCPKMNGAVEVANNNIKKIVGKMTETYSGSGQ